VYTQLIEQFTNHHLLDTSAQGIQQFKNITKNHVLIFLKELDFSGHYENVHLIHHTITGIPPNDISHLEDKLLDDFDVLINLYEKRYKYINRKSFINTQFVLYQLLLRHKYPCKEEEFIILKTIDCKIFYDEICAELFSELSWNHTKYF
jgi:hypothetical protein